MINTFYEKLAKLVVNYSIKVKEGDRIIITGPALAKDLILATYTEIIKAGGHTLLLTQIEGTQEIFFKYASEKQLVYVDNIQKTVFKEFDGLIQILGDYNPYKHAAVDPKRFYKHPIHIKEATRKICEVKEFDTYYKGIFLNTMKKYEKELVKLYSDINNLDNLDFENLPKRSGINNYSVS